MNLYAYVSNNPVGFVDPWGLKTKAILTKNNTTFDLKELYKKKNTKKISYLRGEQECGGFVGNRIDCALDKVSSQVQYKGFDRTIRNTVDNSDFLNGLTMGDANEKQNFSSMAGQYVGGELYGPLADSRDMGVTLKNCKKTGITWDCGVNFVGNGFAYIPAIGGVGKQVIKKGGDVLPMVVKNGIDVAKKIANGHALKKHLHEFKVLGINTVEKLEEFIKSVIKKADGTKDFKLLDKSRKAYIDQSTQAIVVVDPGHVDFGTVFIHDPLKTGYPTAQSYLINKMK